MITKPIRLQLYKDVPKNDKGVFSSKYFHITIISEMASHQGVHYFYNNSIWGQSLGHNQET